MNKTELAQYRRLQSQHYELSVVGRRRATKQDPPPYPMAGRWFRQVQMKQGGKWVLAICPCRAPASGKKIAQLLER